MPQAYQRQPVPYRSNPARVEVIRESPLADRVINLGDQVKQLQTQSSVPAARILRRLLFVWLRIYVHEVKHGKTERVNVGIPIPIPLIGATFARQLSFRRAATLAAQARRGQDVSEELESAMGLEFIRVEEESPERGKRSLVVIGLD